MAFIFYIIGFELLLNRVTMAGEFGETWLSNLVAIKFYFICTKKTIESRLRESKRSFKRTIIGDFFRVFYPTMCYTLMFNTSMIKGAIMNIPWFLMIHLLVYSVNIDIFIKLYGENKYGKALVMFTYAIMKIEGLFTAYKKVHVQNFYLVIFHILNTHSLTTCVINIIEDYFLIKYTTLKKRIPFAGPLNSLLSYCVMVPVVITGEFLKSQGLDFFGPSSFLGIDNLMRMICLFILMFHFCDRIQKRFKEQNIFEEFRSHFPNLTNYSYSPKKVKVD
ncbi:unnamed protein product [Moneuplotes crassus]|uniref:Uncharacterized protein n=1 Tax=Euplotes crassus TaxID=5936 RepID=A0AAD2D1F7_EUPCR|nr:unnamed protein product [Moneuplotes crassus]